MGGIANPLETMDMFKSSIFSKNLKILLKCLLSLKVFFLKYCCRFLKDYSTRHCFSKMLGNWKKRVDKVKGVGALLTYLSKS